MADLEVKELADRLQRIEQVLNKLSEDSLVEHTRVQDIQRDSERLARIETILETLERVGQAESCKQHKERLVETEKRISQLEKIWWKISGASIVAAAVGGFLVKLLIN